MTLFNSNLACVEVTWAQPLFDKLLKGEFTCGFENQTMNRISQLGVLVPKPEVSGQEVIACEISSFSPEHYALKSPIAIKIIGQGCEYIASHHESNIHASGDTPYEAIENLKSLILDTFDLLTSEPQENMGIKAKNQRALLESIIERQ